MVNSTAEKKEGTKSRNIFEDPEIAKAAQNDPFVRFISENWHRVLVTLAAIGLGMIAYNTFMTTADQKRASATELFNNIREEYDLISQKQNDLLIKEKDASDKSGKAKDEADGQVTKLKAELQEQREKVKLMLASLDSPPPFDLLSKLYSGLVAARFNEFDLVNSTLTTTSWETTGRAKSTERFIAELAALGLAKALVDSNQYIQTAKDTLTALAQRGNFTAVPAVDSLASIADSPEDRAKVSELISSVKQRFPSQDKFLSKSMERVQ